MFAVRVQHIGRIDAYLAAFGERLAGQSVPQARRGVAVDVGGHGVRVGAQHSLHLVLLERLGEIGHGERAVLRMIDVDGGGVMRDVGIN